MVIIQISVVFSSASLMAINGNPQNRHIITPKMMPRLIVELNKAAFSFGTVSISMREAQVTMAPPQKPKISRQPQIKYKLTQMSVGVILITTLRLNIIARRRRPITTIMLEVRAPMISPTIPQVEIIVLFKLLCALSHPNFAVSTFPT